MIVGGGVVMVGTCWNGTERCYICYAQWQRASIQTVIMWLGVQMMSTCVLTPHKHFEGYQKQFDVIFNLRV